MAHESSDLWQQWLVAAGKHGSSGAWQHWCVAAVAPCSGAVATALAPVKNSTCGFGSSILLPVEVSSWKV